MANYSRLEKSDAKFSEMLGRFGVVTVMEAYVFNYEDACAIVDSTNKSFEGKTAEEIYDLLNTNATVTSGSKLLCKLDTLKVANVTVEGPTKTVTGGQYANTLLKYGKTARLEMQDALGNAEAIEALCGGLVEYSGTAIDFKTRVALHNGSDFSGPKTIIGKSFFIDQKTGQQVDVAILFYQFNPDSIFNLTQDAEGDATVFDMNGDLLTTKITIGTIDNTDSTPKAGTPVKHGVFYSIVDATEATA